MASITDFKKWLDLHDFDDKEIYFLYSAVNEVTSTSGIFSCSKIDEKRLMVKSSEIEESLIISSDEQKQYFLDYIEKTYCNGDVELFYTLANEDEKD